MEDWAEIRRLYRAEKLPIKAIASRGDPLHMAEVFGLSDDAAVRYATNAIKLLESGAE